MKTETRPTEVFVAEDGTEFLDRKLCEAYERGPMQRRTGLKYFGVSHAPDLTEGRGFHRYTLFAVDFQYHEDDAVLDYCFKNFGPRVQYAQGVAPMRGWTVQPIDAEKFRDLKPFRSCGDSYCTLDRVFLSNGDHMTGLPKPTRITQP